MDEYDKIINECKLDKDLYEEETIKKILDKTKSYFGINLDKQSLIYDGELIIVLSFQNENTRLTKSDILKCQSFSVNSQSKIKINDWSIESDNYNLKLILKIDKNENNKRKIFEAEGSIEENLKKK